MKSLKIPPPSTGLGIPFAAPSIFTFNQPERGKFQCIRTILGAFGGLGLMPKPLRTNWSCTEFSIISNWRLSASIMEALRKLKSWETWIKSP